MRLKLGLSIALAATLSLAAVQQHPAYAPISAAQAQQAPAPQKKTIRFCVGKATGVYATVVAPNVEAQIGEMFVIKVVTTDGSPKIGEKLILPVENPDACDMGALQLDASIGSELFVNASLDLFLYKEPAHLVCRRDLHVEDLEDVASRNLKLGTGSYFSGGETFWKGIVASDKKRYGNVVTKPIGLSGAGVLAMNNGEVDCILAISGIKSQDLNNFINEVSAEAVELVPVTGKSFGARTIVVNNKQVPLYTPYGIPAGTYPKIQPTGWWSGKSQEVASTAVDAVLVTRKSLRAGLSPQELEYLNIGLNRAAKAIAAQIAAPVKIEEPAKK